MATVCDVLVSRLAEAGVKQIFGVPGDAINSLLEAIRLQNKIEFIHVIHEEAGAFAASAQAKLTGNLAVCAGTAGPGAIHLLNGLYDAKCDHAPVLAITGQVETKNIGHDYQQEINLLQLFSDVSVYNETVMNPAQMPFIASRAIRSALENKGVAHLNIPLDIASKSVPDSKSWPSQPPCPDRHPADTAAIMQAAELINNSERAAILAGIGCRDVEDLVYALAQKIKAPIIHSLRAKELFPETHPYSIGGLGNLGISPAVDAIAGCDLLLLIGTDFPYADYLPKKARIVQIDLDPKQIGKRVPVDAGVVGDTGMVLASLQSKIGTKSSSDFLSRAQKAMQKWKARTADELSIEHAGLIKPQRLAYLIGEKADANAVFVCDTGEVTAWTARYMPMKPGQRFTVSGMLATMAFGFPGAIGAKLAYPNRQVIAICGDGGFAMLMSDFATAVKYKLPICVIIFNNRRLGMIQIEQEAKGYPSFETDMFTPDFADFAKLCGGDGVRVSDPRDIDAALTAGLTSKSPFVIDVLIDRKEMPLPPYVTMAQSANYGMAKLKELIEVRR